MRKDRNKFIGISLAEDEKDFISKAAEKSDQCLSDFCRRVLIEVASDILEILEE